MQDIHFRFYAELNDFLPAPLRGSPISLRLNRRTSIKDMIESLGIPHTEVDAIVVNGKAVHFSYILQPQDLISVYPAFSSLDTLNENKLRPPLTNGYRFVLDCHLGKLAKYLRQLGFDTLYENNFDDEELAHISSVEQRILLTRDRNLLKRSIIDYGYFVRHDAPRQQLDEVIRRYTLQDKFTPFGLCSRCNGTISSVRKSDIIERLELKTRQYYDRFYQCNSCSQLYWEGSHFDNMRKLIKHLSGHSTH